MMMKVAMITRSTLFSCKGGDTIQVMQTARHLAELGVEADIKLTDEPINYTQYHLLHFFNIIRPADILFHIKRSGKPYVVSTILVDYSEYDQRDRKSSLLLRFFSSDGIEYIKTIARVLAGRDVLMSTSYLWKGQRRCIRQIIKDAAMLLPNSFSEYARLLQKYQCNVAYSVIPNGIDTALFPYNSSAEKDPLLVICVARIEGIKNQLNLIKALNGTRYTLLIIGSPSPNQRPYYQACKKAAAANIFFMKAMPQQQLFAYYQKAKVHVLPSWFETTGLSSLEAAAMGCNIVVSAKGDTKEYFGSDAYYCDPGSVHSIFDAIEAASSGPVNHTLQQKIVTTYTWQHAAQYTMRAYHSIMETI